MLILTTLSIMLSLILLSLFAIPLIQGRKPKPGTLGIGAPFMVVGWPCVWFPPVALQYLLLVALFCVDAYWALSTRLYLTVACLLTLFVYASFGITILAHIHSLRQEFLFESMEARLVRATPVAVQRGKLVTDTSFANLEEALDTDYRYRAGLRNESLKELHANTVWAFVNSPGFGVARMPSTDQMLRYGLHEENTFPQPVPKKKTSGSYFPDSPVPPISPGFLKLHHDSVLDFTYPEGFGYFKDRQHVAGFRPHQFRRVPEPELTWKLETVELIGLVLHSSAVAYISDKLPRMDLLREARTRPLDTFEAAALLDLRAGNALAARDQGERIRMLGPLRAAKQCIACHGCVHGELLGAFSYVLRQY